MAGSDLADDLGHATQRPLLDALGQAHDRDAGNQARLQLGEHVTKAVRRHAHHDDVGTLVPPSWTSLVDSSASGSGKPGR